MVVDTNHILPAIITSLGLYGGKDMFCVAMLFWEPISCYVCLWNGFSSFIMEMWEENVDGGHACVHVYVSM